MVILIPEPELRSRRDLSRFVSTGARGEFHFRGVVPGKYLVVAFAQTEPEFTWDEALLKEVEASATSITVGSKTQMSMGVVPIAKLQRDK